MNQFTIKSVESNTEDQPDSLKIKRTKSLGHFKGSMTILKFQDKDTKQIISYCPSFDISGYGDTEEKAIEMLKFNISELFNHLTRLSPKQMESELSDLGWKQSKFRHKEYSKAYVDINGQLQNLNAVDNKVERLTLHAA